MYLSFLSPSFDIWSKNSVEREGKIRPKIQACSETDGSVSEALKALIPSAENEDSNESITQLNYLEKMPEHVLRIPTICESCFASSENDKMMFIYMTRDWVQVALSIHHLCGDS